MINKSIFSEYEAYTGDTVIHRGHMIYDEWVANKLSSRTVVARVENALSIMQLNKTQAASADALAFLFALDLRVQEKYHNVIRCLFSYFSWRRETRALKNLKGIFNISDSNGDIRTAIEMALKKLREKLENDEADNGDDETHGGKRNGKSEEEAVVAEEKGEEQESEEKAEEAVDAEEEKEASDEKTEDTSEPGQSEEPLKEDDTQLQLEEVMPEEAVILSNEEKEQVNEETKSELKEENNGSDKQSEPSTDKKAEAKTYHDAVDYPPLYDEEAAPDKPVEKMSFIDEVIMDNMIKGKEDFIWHNPLDDIQPNHEADHPKDMAVPQGEASQSSDKDAYLYDKMAVTDQAEIHQSEKSAPAQRPEKIAEIKTEQPKETMQTSNHIQLTEQALNPTREPIQVDISPEQENDMRGEINDILTREQVLAIRDGQEAAMREQLNILSEEFLRSMDPVESIEKSDLVQIDPSTTIASRK